MEDRRLDSLAGRPRTTEGLSLHAAQRGTRCEALEPIREQDPPIEYESLLKPARAPLDRPHDRGDQYADGDKVGVIGRREAPFHEVPSPLRTRVVPAGFGHVDETVAANPARPGRRVGLTRLELSIAVPIVEQHDVTELSRQLAADPAGRTMRTAGLSTGRSLFVRASLNGPTIPSAETAARVTGGRWGRK